MPKAQTAVDEPVTAAGPNLDRTNTIHLHMQAKGGVGKSYTAWLMTQYLQSQGCEVKAWDTDPGNHTFWSFQKLGVQRFEIMNEHNQFVLEKFDDLTNKLILEPGPHVIDTGASNFFALGDYIGQNRLLHILQETHGKRILVHVPVTGGPMLTDTVRGLGSILKMVPDHTILAWLNHFWGTLEVDGKVFREWKVFTENRDKYFNAVSVGYASSSLENTDIKLLLERRKTFDEAINDAEYAGMIQRHRLSVAKTALFAKLEAAGL